MLDPFARFFLLCEARRGEVDGGPALEEEIHREPRALHGRIDAMVETDPAVATATI